MSCAVCQSDVPAGARFCPNCGTAVPSGPPLRELRKTVTVLFCDMTESTALSGRLDAEALRELMVRYYALMSSCLERHGGTVEKFIGDAVMAVFGIPVLHEDDARRALSAATEMLGAVETLNEELRGLIGVEIGVRIGVNTGEVVAAEDTSSGQALAAGEAVNVAARLQQQAAPGEIILGPVTRTLVGAGAVVAPVGELSLKGKAERVPAWRLLELRSPDANGFHDLDAPFFGRAAELDRLTRLWEQAVRSASCRLVALHGDPGVGKTRLAAEFATRAAEQGALVGVGRCPPYGEGTTLRAFGEALRQIVHAAPAILEPSPDVKEALSYLESGLLRDGSPGGPADQLVWAATLVLETIGRAHPVLMVLDDLHSAKPVLLDVVDQVVDRISAPVLVLGLGRPELLEAAGAWCTGRPNASSLSLGPLGDEEVSLLVGALSEVVPHRAGLAEQIAERAEGNPFFAEQLVAMADQSGTDSLPPTVQSVIAARLDLLDAVEREVLLRAAVPGRRFSAAELDALLAEEPALGDPPDQVLATLTRRRLLAPDGEEYRFSGVLIRDVAYNTLAKRDRQRFHEALARWYRVHVQSSDQAGLHLERAYRLAAELRPADQHHLRLRADAATTLAASGARALRRSDLHWAADLLARALDLHDETGPGRKVVGVQLAEAGLLLGTDPHARDTLRTLAGDAWTGGDRRTAYHARLLLAALEPPGPSADEDALAAVPVFEAAGDHLGLTRAWLRVAQLRQLDGHYGEAEVLLRYALRHALQTEAHLELATVIGGLATGFWRGPTPVAAALAGCRALLAEHAAGRRAVRATVNCPYAVLLAYRGEYDESRAMVQDAILIIEQLGHVYGAATMLIFAAAVEGLAGKWDAAEVLLRDATAAGARTGDALSSAAAGAGLARALLEQGKDDAALQATEGKVTTGDPFLEAEVHGVRARVFAGRGDRERALPEVDRAAEIAAVTDSTACQATAELDRAHVLRALGDHMAATDAAKAAEKLFVTKGHLVGARWAASFGVPDRSMEAP